MALQGNLRKQLSLLIAFNHVSLPRSTYATTKKKNVVATKTIDSVRDSIASKGFLRPNKSYEPPKGVAEKVRAICTSLQIPNIAGAKFDSLEQKFKLLDSCFQEFQHSVSNSQIHEMQSIDHIISFYETAVDTTVPYEALKKMDLPENMHIQYEYVRFNPETDTKFNGQTAFPKSSTLVTGLKYRGKYPGHIAKQSWP